MIAVLLAAIVGAGIVVANVPVSDEQKLIDENRTSFSVAYEKLDGATKITRVIVIPDAGAQDCNKSENSVECNYKWGRETTTLKASTVFATTELNAKALDCHVDKGEVHCVERQKPLTDMEWILRGGTITRLQ